jgi:ribosomal protein S18 acetylase RimI-like enzyme
MFSPGEPSVDVRGLALEDYDALCRLVREIDELHARLLPGYFRRSTKPPRTRAEVERVLGAHTEKVLVAEVEGLVVGLVHVQLFDTPPVPVQVPCRRAHVDNLVVTASERRRGIGKKLLGAAADWARKNGAEEVLLTVWAGNQDAERFYASLGFRSISTVLSRPL